MDGRITMFRMLLQGAFRWIVALGTLFGSGALIGTVPLFQEAAPALEFELADVEPPAEELLPEIVVEPDVGMFGLAFHPAIMYRGGDECKDTYIVRGSLKNHGPQALEGVEVTYTVPSSVTVELISPTSPAPLGTDKPLRIEMMVSITDAKAWELGELPDVVIPLTATGKIDETVVSTATGTVYIYNVCPAEVDGDLNDNDDDDDEDGMGIAGLVFHPGHLNSGGVCRTTYTAQGSLKNHGPGAAIDVTLTYTIPDGYEEVIDVEILNGTADELTTSKPLRFTVNVHIIDIDEWKNLGKGESITIQISAQGADTNVATATMTVRNQCKGADSKVKGDDLGEKGKPDKPSHPLEGGPPGQEKDKGKPSHPLEGGPPGQSKEKKNK
jgi:hypothetical protein